MKGLVILALLIPCMALSNEIIWEENIGPFGGNIFDMAVDNDLNIYALSQSNGLFLSSNNGASWKNIFHSDTIDSYDEISIDIEGRIFLNPVLKGIFYSEDKGMTWGKIPMPVETPPNANILTMHANRFGLYISVLNYGLYRTTDLGASWDLLGNENDFKTGITLATDYNGYIWFAYLRNLYKSTDQGSSWELFDSIPSNIRCFYFRDNGEMLIGTDNFIRRFHTHFESYVDYSEGLLDQGSQALCELPGGIFISGSRLALFISKDTCKTWEVVSAKYDISKVNAIVRGSDNRVLAGTLPNGVFHSDDFGETWQNPNKGLSALSVKSLFFDKSGRIYAGTSESGLFASDDMKNWEHIYKNQSIDDIYVNENGSIFLATTRGGLIWSNDGGILWNSKYSSAYRACFNIERDANGAIYGSASQRLWISNDNGYTFDEFLLDSTFRNLKVFRIAQNGDFYMGMIRGPIYRSRDKGIKWDTISHPYPNKTLNNMRISLIGDIFLALDSVGIIKSTDGGQTWATSVSCLKVNNVVYIHNGGLLACTNKGIFISYDHGSEWALSSAGMIFHNTLTARIDGENRLYAGTRGGIYRSGAFSNIANDDQTNSNPFKILPNPASDFLQLQFFNVYSELDRIEIIDIYGRVKLSSDINTTNGAFSEKINISSLTCGVYIVKVNSGGKVFSEMILIVI